VIPGMESWREAVSCLPERPIEIPDQRLFSLYKCLNKEVTWMEKQENVRFDDKSYGNKKSLMMDFLAAFFPGKYPT
jgi:hypothetical protein